MKNVFHFILKGFFVLKIFKFLSWIFAHAHVEKMTWLERKKFKKFMMPHKLVNKQLQYTYCTISHKVKANR